MMPAIRRIGVSACLLGYRVRYDGKHKRHNRLASLEKQGYLLIPLCPEAELGLGIPRSPIHLTRRNPASPIRLSEADLPETDHTDRMINYVISKARLIDGFSGLILKSRSPSCGTNEIPVYGTDGKIVSQGRGIFANEIKKRFPRLPLIEETVLNDDHLTNQFLVEVLGYSSQD